MTRLAATVLATALALAAVGGATLGTAQGAAEQTQEAALPPAQTVQFGQCQIQYETLPDANQPAAMECEHAEWIARRWGGSVMEQTGEGLVERARFEGVNDFSGVPSNALPRRGYCRAWIDGLDEAAQPEESDCRAARTMASARGGRVIYMPL